jgi:sugar transferase (PEP-CTERM/EpsH1 system associated)
MKILWITNKLPYPLVSGGKIRVYHLLSHIAQHHEVTLLSLLDSPDEIRYLPHLQPYCSTIETAVKKRRRSRVKLFFRILKSILKGQPPRNAIALYEDLRSKLEEVVHNNTFDIIQIEQSNMAPYIENATGKERSVNLISLYDIGATQRKRLLDLQTDLQSRFWTWLDWIFVRRWEPTYLARHFDKCMVVSSVDQAWLQKANPTLDVVVIPNGVDTTQYTPLVEDPASKSILFIGKMSYPPNVDGASYFCEEILHLIQQQIPDINLMIVGQEPVPSVQALASDIVTVTGYVESIIPYYQQSFVSVIPLRAGSGTRLKILEAMALGRVVVTTTLGCEGLDVTHGENILIADTSADFADQVVRVFKDKELRQHLVKNGRHLVETTYDWKAIGEKLLKVYEKGQ